MLCGAQRNWLLVMAPYLALFATCVVDDAGDVWVLRALTMAASVHKQGSLA